jgi:hypothetical protein
MELFSQITDLSLSPDFLVGIEMNPGPVKSQKKKVVQKIEKQVAQQIVAKVAKPHKGSQPQSMLSKLAGYAPDAGASIGGLFGPVGAKVGGIAGSLVSKIFGSGDYKVEGNTLMGTPVPTFAMNGRSTIISHREYLGDISGSTAFTNKVYAINPGLSNTFPWLSQVAANYEQYRMLGLIFEYRPTSGTAVSSTNTALGTVVMATDYDAENPPFSNKQQMESYEFASSCVPYDKMLHPVECSTKEKTIDLAYIRTGPLSQVTPTSTDIQFYDLGNFQIATNGMQVGVTVIGELWVSYHVELLKPRIDPLSLNQYLHVRENPAATAAAATAFGVTGATGSCSLGSTLLANATGLPYIVSPTTVFMPDKGQYLASFVATNSAGAVTYTLGANLSQTPLVYADNTNGQASVTSGGSCVGSSIISVNVGATGPTGSANGLGLSFSGQTAGSTDLFIFPMPAYNTNTVV